MLHALILKITLIQGPHYTSSLSLFLASPSFSSSPLNSFHFLPLLLSSSFLVPPPSSLYLCCVSTVSADRQTLRSNRRLRERHSILLNGQIRESKVLLSLPPLPVTATTSVSVSLPPYLSLLLPLSLSPCCYYHICLYLCVPATTSVSLLLHMSLSLSLSSPPTLAAL